MFDPSYNSALKTAYGDQVTEGYFETEEKEYAQGAEFLSQKLSEEQKSILASMESNYTEKCSIASTYPFYQLHGKGLPAPLVPRMAMLAFL